MAFGIHVLHLEIHVVGALGKLFLDPADNGIRPRVPVFVGIEEKDILTGFGRPGYGWDKDAQSSYENQGVTAW